MTLGLRQAACSSALLFAFFCFILVCFVLVTTEMKSVGR